jgi:hypothetical protein
MIVEGCLIGVIIGSPITQNEQRRKEPEVHHNPPSVRIRDVREERPNRVVKARPSTGGELKGDSGGVVGVGVWTRIIEGVFGW